MTSLKPVGKRVIIEPLQAEETTTSGLIIPDTAKTTPQEATVIAIGTEVTTDDIKVGDVVIYSMYGGTKVSYGGKSYLIMDTVDLIAVVER
jgi:chaperonin GroES